MKTYDVTVRFTMVKINPPLDKRDPLAAIADAMGCAVKVLAINSGTAVDTPGVEIIDRDSLPQAAAVCSRCERAV